jgi:hypothetical protein
MRKLVSVVLGVACLTAAVAPVADAHTLTKKRARSALKPVVADITPTVAPVIAAKLPGATVSSSGVGPCDIVRKGHRAECVLTFELQGAATGETACGLDARVEFKNNKSKQLDITVGSVLVCFFPIELP